MLNLDVSKYIGREADEDKCSEKKTVFRRIERVVEKLKSFRSNISVHVLHMIVGSNPKG